MNSVFQMVLSMSISGSILIIILILLKPFIKEGYSKAWQYYIWIIVIVRLLVPYSPKYGLVNDIFQTQIVDSIKDPHSAVNDFIEHHASDTSSITQQGQEEDEVPSLTEAPVASVAAERHNLPEIWEIGSFIWMIGIIIFFITRIYRYMYFINKIKRSAEPVADSQILLIYRRVAKELGIHNRLQIYYCGQIASPMLIGLRKPIIFLTDRTIQMDVESLSYVLRHELMHYKRHDLWYKWCCDITVCIHWFNPLIYLMSRYINLQCEISCDEALVKDLSAAERIVYGNVLLNAVTENIKFHNKVLSSSLYEDKISLKERILSIMNVKRKSKWVISLSVIIALLLCIVAFWLGAYTTKNSNIKDGAKGTDTAVIASDTTTGNIETPSVNNNTSKDSVNQEAGNSNTASTASDSSEARDNTEQASSDNTQANTNIAYSNTEYGFDFTLPSSWEGYSVLTEDWQGKAISGDHTGEVVESGKEIILRHPSWTKADPYQDIPIMVFSLDQWDQVVKEEIALGAAQIAPSKLGSNSKYVFALPARYNFAYPTGYEDVEKIMESNPLSPIDNFK